MSADQLMRQDFYEKLGFVMVEAMRLVVLAVAGWSVALAGWVSDVGSPDPVPVVCLEDMPCWDCSSMGNRVCGGERELVEVADGVFVVRQRLTRHFGDGGSSGWFRYHEISGRDSYVVVCDSVSAFGVSGRVALGLLNSPVDGTCVVR